MTGGKTEEEYLM